jgi:hypothetical protein
MPKTVYYCHTYKKIREKCPKPCIIVIHKKIKEKCPKPCIIVIHKKLKEKCPKPCIIAIHKKLKEKCPKPCIMVIHKKIKSEARELGPVNENLKTNVQVYAKSEKTGPGIVCIP